MDESWEMDTAEDKEDPTYVPRLSDEMRLDTSAAKSSEIPAMTEIPSNSEDSIMDINETCKKKRNMLKRAKSSKNRIITTDSDKEKTWIEEEEAEGCFVTMSGAEIGACDFEALNRIETVNIKSKNIKGGLKGQLRDSIKELREIMTAMMLKLNARGDIEMLKAVNTRETAKNLELMKENEKLKKEKAVLNIRLVKKGETTGQDKQRNHEATMEEDFEMVNNKTPGIKSGNRKRRKMKTPSPLTDTETDGHSKKKEGKGTRRTDRRNEVMEMDEFRMEAEISHMKTREAVKEARRTLAESDDMREEKNNIGNGGHKMEKTLESIYKMIGECLKNGPQNENKKPRIINVEKVNPPFDFRLRQENENTSQPTTSWAEVAAKIPWKSQVSEKYRERAEINMRSDNGSYRSNMERPVLAQDNRDRERNRLRMINQRNNRSAAVTLQCDNDARYNEIITKAKREIQLEELGIDDCKIRRGYTGGMVIEIPGEEANQKADALADKLKEVLGREDVRIGRSFKKANLKIFNMEETTKKEEIRTVLTAIGGCNAEDIRVSEIQVTARNVRIAWIQCPVEAAIKILDEKRIRIGWTTVRCETVLPKPLRCFRCLETGHSRQGCTSEIDRSNNCYNCGELGHSAADCRNKPMCMLCKFYNKRCDHKIGTIRCTPVTQEERRNVRYRRTDARVSETR